MTDARAPPAAGRIHAIDLGSESNTMDDATLPRRIRCALSRIPVGVSEGWFGGRRWGIRRDDQQGGRVVKLFAEERGGADFVSANVYTARGAPVLKPCEMPAARVLEFLEAVRVDTDVYGAADLYALAFPPPDDALVDWVVSLSRSPKTVLEPFCGHAPAALQFVERGLRYLGVDRSGAMLTRGPDDPRIALVECDAAELALPPEAPAAYEIAWCPVNSIAHLGSEEATRRHLTAVRARIRPGGAYAVELEIYDRATEHGAAEWTVDLGDGRSVEASWRVCEVDRGAHTRREEGRFRLMDGEECLQESREEFTMRMWTFDDLMEIPRDCGWDLESWTYAASGSAPGARERLTRHVENSGRNRHFVLRPRGA